MRHYLSFSVVIVTAGVVLGAAAGTLLAPMVANLYVRYFQFPEFTTALHLPSLAVACAVARHEFWQSIHPTQRVWSHNHRRRPVNPPTMIFIGSDGEELRQHRVVGEVDARDFLHTLSSLPAQSQLTKR